MFERLTGAVEWAQHRHASSIVAGLAVAGYIVLGWYVGAPRDYALAAMVALILIGVPLVNHLHPPDEE